MIRQTTLLLTLIFSITFLSISKADLVDQQQLTVAGSLGSFDGHQHNVQSFQQDRNNITGASVAIINVPVGTTITISLFNSFAAVSNLTNAIAQGSVITTSTSSSVPQFETVSFFGGAGQPSSPLAVPSGQPLFLAFSKSTGSNLGSFGGVTTSLYADGHVYSNGFSFPNLDFAFQTFSAVPEPSAGLILVSVFAFASCRRRREAV